MDSSGQFARPGRAYAAFLVTAVAASAIAYLLSCLFPGEPASETVTLGLSGWIRLALVALSAIFGSLALRGCAGARGEWPVWPASVPALIACVVLAGAMSLGERSLRGKPGDEIQKYRTDDGPGPVIQWYRPGQMDSMGLLCRGGAVCALAGAILFLLPEAGRRVALVLVAGFHFCGILTAVFSVPPPGGNAPWLVQQAWVHLYRPYLQFVYLNNAYHFYSPEPGPPSFMWYRIDYADGERRWLRYPDDMRSPIRIHFQRLLSIGESANQPSGREADQVRAEEVHQRIGQMLRMPELPRDFIAPVAWRDPAPNTRILLGSYVRSVAERFPNSDKSGAEILEVRLWRVVHSIIGPEQFSRGVDPSGRKFFVTCYQGLYDKSGIVRTADPDEPLKFWLLTSYDRDDLARMRERAGEQETRMIRIRDLRATGEFTGARQAVIEDEIKALGRLRRDLEDRLAGRKPSEIDLFALQAEIDRFPPPYTEVK